MTKTRHIEVGMDLTERLSENVVQLARLGLAGRAQDVQAYLRQAVRRLKGQEPALARELSELLARAPTALSPLRDFGSALVPVDADSRSEERRVGKECVSTCRSRWSPYH